MVPLAVGVSINNLIPGWPSINLFWSISEVSHNGHFTCRIMKSFKMLSMASEDYVFDKNL
jgi:hypothetical protein